MAGGLLPHTHNFWQPTFNINFHWRVGEFRHYVKFSGCKIRFYDATKKFYKPADWMSPSLAYTYSCIKVHSIYRQTVYFKTLIDTFASCFMKDNSVNFELHATSHCLIIDNFESRNEFDTIVSMSQKRLSRHLVFLRRASCKARLLVITSALTFVSTFPQNC